MPMTTAWRRTPCAIRYAIDDSGFSKTRQPRRVNRGETRLDSDVKRHYASATAHLILPTPLCKTEARGLLTASPSLRKRYGLPAKSPMGCESCECAPDCAYRADAALRRQRSIHLMDPTDAIE